jgi:exopolyphosphatase/guanosine-5'-triphosphate,3'-diphosphate pyrophosphatase
LYSASQVVSLLVLLRMAVLLNQKRRDDFLPELKAQGQNQQLSLQLPKEWLEQQPLLVADLQQEQLHLKKIAFVLDCPYLIECSLQSPGFDPSNLDEE